MQKVLVIIGPTGVGKTDLSLKLAKELNGEIISGDSIQVYQGLDIGSAKATLEEREMVKHHLIDIKDVEEDYSVYDYQKDARKILDDLISKNKNVIIVGGTGLYLKALLYNFEFKENSINEKIDFNNVKF